MVNDWQTIFTSVLTLVPLCHSREYNENEVRFVCIYSNLENDQLQHLRYNNLSWYLVPLIIKLIYYLYLCCNRLITKGMIPFNAYALSIKCRCYCITNIMASSKNQEGKSFTVPWKSALSLLVFIRKQDLVGIRCEQNLCSAEYGDNKIRQGDPIDKYKSCKDHTILQVT